MSDGPQCCLGLNPDVTGIGVRVALYIQILLGWGVSLISPDSFAKNARTAYMTAIALIIAALIQHKTQDPQQLSLLDAIVISMITTMMVTFAISSSPTRSNVNQSTASNETEEIDPNASYSRYLTQFAFVGLWAGWCINLWVDPLHFGFKNSLPECNVNENVVIILFGRSIRATDERMRNAALVFVSVGIFLAFGSLWISLEQLLGPCVRFLRRGVDSMTRDLNQKPPEDSILTFIRRCLQGLSFATLIFLIVETEATIRRNDTENSSTEWSYGQTIALILLLQQIMDVSSTCLEKWPEWKEKWAKWRGRGNDVQQSDKSSDVSASMVMQPLSATQPAASPPIAMPMPSPHPAPSATPDP